MRIVSEIMRFRRSATFADCLSRWQKPGIDRPREVGLPEGGSRAMTMPTHDDPVNQQYALHDHGQHQALGVNISPDTAAPAEVMA